MYTTAEDTAVEINKQRKGKKTMKLNFEEAKTIFENLASLEIVDDETNALMKKIYTTMVNEWPTETKRWFYTRNK